MDNIVCHSKMHMCAHFGKIVITPMDHIVHIHITKFHIFNPYKIEKRIVPKFPPKISLLIPPKFPSYFSRQEFQIWIWFTFQMK
jgi:hypothetical protein